MSDRKTKEISKSEKKDKSEKGKDKKAEETTGFPDDVDFRKFLGCGG